MLELRSHLKGLGADISEEQAESGILTDLRHIIEASSLCLAEVNNETGRLCLRGETSTQNRGL